MKEVKFSCSALPAGKAGTLPVDSDGYFTIAVGGLNCFNSAGEYYRAERAKSLFQSSSAFMRRIKDSCLKSEYGHPKRVPGMSDQEFLRRMMQIEETQVCGHFKEIWLDLGAVGQYGPDTIPVLAKVAPSGPFADALDRSLRNPKEDVCFSIRAFTEDQLRSGVNQRDLVDVVTYDYVTEPGISIARKMKTSALESLCDEPVDQKALKALVNEKTPGLGLESAQIAMASRLLSLFGWEDQANGRPIYMNW